MIYGSMGMIFGTISFKGIAFFTFSGFMGILFQALPVLWYDFQKSFRIYGWYFFGF